MLTWIDYTIVAIIGLSVIISFVRGFVREALSLVIWVSAFWVAFTFSQALASLLVNTIHTASLREIAAFGALLVATLILGALLNYLIGQLVDKTGLSGTDRILGLVFGVTRGVLLVTVLIMMGRLTTLPVQADSWKDSILIPYFHPVEIWLHDLLPRSVQQHFVITY